MRSPAEQHKIHLRLLPVHVQTGAATIWRNCEHNERPLILLLSLQSIGLKKQMFILSALAVEHRAVQPSVSNSSPFLPDHYHRLGDAQMHIF